MNKNEKLMELCQDENFKKAVEKLTAEDRTTVEDLRGLFAENGLELTAEEVADFCRQVAECGETDGEISEEALESVAGGNTYIFSYTFIINCVRPTPLWPYCTRVYNSHPTHTRVVVSPSGKVGYIRG